MSDGPHRSLPLPKLWKELTKRADQQAYGLAEIAEAAANALAGDLKNEVKWALLDALKSIFIGRDNSLESPEIALQELEIAKKLAAGSVFGRNAVAFSIELINAGNFGLDAFYEAIGAAAKHRAFASIKSVEEHYVREASQKRATNVKARLQSAISGLSENRLGLLLAKRESAISRSTRKKTNIDEGVPLQ
jgi:hypothetical protein